MPMDAEMGSSPAMFEPIDPKQAYESIVGRIESRIQMANSSLATSCRKDTEFHLLMAEASHNLPLATLLDAILPLMNPRAKQFKARFTGPGTRWARSGAQMLTPVRAAIMSRRFDSTQLRVCNSLPS